MLITVIVLSIIIVITLAWCRKFDEQGVVGYALRNSYNEVLMEEIVERSETRCIPKVFKSRKEENNYMLDNRVKYYTTALYKSEFNELKHRCYHSYGKNN